MYQCNNNSVNCIQECAQCIPFYYKRKGSLAGKSGRKIVKRPFGYDYPLSLELCTALTPLEILEVRKGIIFVQKDHIQVSR